MTGLLFVGALAQLVYLAFQHGGFRARPKRLLWVLPLTVAVLVFGLLAATDYNHEGGMRLGVAVLGVTALLFGMASYLLVPRNQR